MALITTAARSELIALYVAMFKAAPGATNLTDMVTAYEAGGTTATIAKTLAAKADFATVYPGYTTGAEFSASVVATLLGSNVTAAITTWAEGYILGLLNAGRSRSEAIVTAVVALRATANTEFTVAQAALANKVDVASYYSMTAGQSSTSLQVLQAVIAGVTSVASTVTAAKASADIVPVVAAVPFTLTTGVDVADNVSASRGNLTSTFVFTGKNEVVNASFGTLNDADILLDSSTSDNDVLSVSGGTGTFTASNIETINLTTAVAATLQLDNVSGVKNVNVTGTNTVAVDGFAAATLQPTFGINSITRTVTVAPATFAGTTAGGDAETLNISVSGLSFGTTAATQSVIALDGVVDGALEVLNLTSTGSSANDVGLTFDAGDTVSKLNIAGSTNLTVRVADAAISGVAVDASTNTGVVALLIDRNGSTTAATSAVNYVGVDSIIFADSTAGVDAAVLTSAADGQAVTYAANFATGTAIGILGATGAAPKNALSVTLDHLTADTGVNIVRLDLQDTKAVTITSSGFATSTSATGANVIDDLTGDTATITIAGDTSLEVDLNIDAAFTASTGLSTTARVVTVSAAGMTGTAFVNLTEIATASSDRVTYNITGTANADLVTLNNSGGTVVGGAGNDTITGGNGADVISGGLGNDRIVLSNTTSLVADTVTLGDGIDTVVVGAANVTSVAEIQTITVTGAADTASSVIINILGVDVVTVIAGDEANVTAVAAKILTAIQASSPAVAGSVVPTVAAGVITLTYPATSGDVAALQIRTLGETSLTDSDLTETVQAQIFTAVTGTAGVTARDVNTNITDFSSVDLIDADALVTSADVVYAEGAANVTATSTVIVLLTSFATVALAEDAVIAAGAGNIDGIVLFLNSSIGKVQMFYDADLDTDNTLADTAATVITFDNITSLVGIADTFASTNFII